MIFVAIGITALLMVAVFAALALTDADAEQGPPPTLLPVRDAASLPFGLDDGLDEYRAAWDRHVADALAVAGDDFALWLAEIEGDRRRA